MTGDIVRIKESMITATKHLEAASRKIDQLQVLMDENDINDIVEIGGMKAHALSQSFLKCCVKIATANPRTSKRAFEMLRTGEWRL